MKYARSDLVCDQQPRIDLHGRALALEVEQERLAPEPLDRASVQLFQWRPLHQDSMLEQAIKPGLAEALNLGAIYLSDRVAINPLQH
jgi:hypothetical protein